MSENHPCKIVLAAVVATVMSHVEPLYCQERCVATKVFCQLTKEVKITQDRVWFCRTGDQGVPKLFPGVHVLHGLCNSSLFRSLVVFCK